MAPRKHLDVLSRGRATGKPYVDLQLHADELRAIGRVTTNWSFPEFLILRETQNLAASLKAPIPEEAEYVSFGLRLEAWERLAAPALSGEPGKRTAACIGRIREIQDQRHQLTHRIIEYDPNDRRKLGAYTRANFRDRKFAWRFDAARIEETARNIAHLAYDILSIHAEPVSPRDVLQQKRGMRDGPDRQLGGDHQGSQLE